MPKKNSKEKIKLTEKKERRSVIYGARKLKGIVKLFLREPKAK